MLISENIHTENIKKNLNAEKFYTVFINQFMKRETKKKRTKKRYCTEKFDTENTKC